MRRSRPAADTARMRRWSYRSGRRPRVVVEQAGQTMAEYAVILSLLTIGAAAVFTVLSGGVANAMTSVTGII